MQNQLTNVGKRTASLGMEHLGMQAKCGQVKAHRKYEGRQVDPNHQMDGPPRVPAYRERCKWSQRSRLEPISPQRRRAIKT